MQRCILGLRIGRCPIVLLVVSRRKRAGRLSVGAWRPECWMPGDKSAKRRVAQQGGPGIPLGNFDFTNFDFSKFHFLKSAISVSREKVPAPC